MTILVPLYAQMTRGADALDAGLLIAPLGVGAIITMPPAGRLTDRLGARGVALCGLALALAGMFAYTRTDAATPAWILMGALFVVGLGHGALAPSLAAASYQGLPGAVIPAATATSNIAIRTATSLGVAVLVIVLQSRLRAAPQAPVHAFSGGFWWALVIALAAVVPAALVPRRPAT